MAKLLLRNARWLDPEGQLAPGSSLLLEDGRIRAHLPAGAAPEGVRSVDLAGRAVAPGFLDLHFHGELMAARGPELDRALGRRCADALRHGTTGFLATTIASAPERLATLVAEWRAAIEHREGRAGDGERGAAVLGIHLEGPWISPQAAGAQPTDGIRPYRAAEGADLLARSQGLVRMVTLAPELPGAGELMTQLAGAGVVAALGHSLADRRAHDAAVDAGMTHATHLFNAMGPMHHRAPGVALRVLDDARLSADVIADGVHVAPELLRLAARLKGERLSLITDQVSERAFPDTLVVRDAGAWRLAEGGALAGSTLELDRALAYVQDVAAMTEHEAVRAVTLAPARVLGIESQRGTLREGARADLVVLAGPRVEETWIAGERVYERARDPASSAA